MIIDAENLVLGRAASFIAKKALLGEKIDIVNCEKAIVIGNKDDILRRYKQKYDRGIHTKGPFIIRSPEMLFKRTIRGMLPYKREIGKRAFKNIKCYIGVPDSLKDKKIERKKNLSVSNLNLRYTTVKDISRLLGARI